MENQAPYETHIEDATAKMKKLWDHAINEVCDKALGRPFQTEDAPRFGLVRKEGLHDQMGVTFDGQQVAWLKGEFIHRDGGVFYTIGGVAP